MGLSDDEIASRTIAVMKGELPPPPNLPRDVAPHFDHEGHGHGGHDHGGHGHGGDGHGH